MKSKIDPAKNFSGKVKYKSFQKALHTIRKMSMERIFANEASIESGSQSIGTPMKKTG